MDITDPRIPFLLFWLLIELVFISFAMLGWRYATRRLLFVLVVVLAHLNFAITMASVAFGFFRISNVAFSALLAGGAGLWPMLMQKKKAQEYDDES